MLRLVTNSVDTDNVRETTIGGDKHLVAEDVTFVRPMRLAGGYVPEDELRDSATRWSGVPLTVNHPRNDAGQPISVNTETGQELVVGHLRNPHDTPDGALSGDLAVNVESAEEMGGEAQDIVDALRNGETLEVSSQYFGEPLPSGNYDGAFREDVEGNLTPDSVALLPNKQGVCSVEDGCGFGATATANAEPSANQEEGDIVRWQSAGGTAYGQVIETIEEGQFDEEITGDVTVTAPAALIQIHRPAESGSWEPTETFVAHKTDNDTLTVINSFPSDFPRANAVTDAAEARSSLSLTADDAVTKAGVTYSDTAEGDLDESEIPNEGYEPHYLYPGDTKSASSYPVVDGDGVLRRENVVAAHDLGCRGMCDDAEEHDRRVTELARQFDDVPEFAQDDNMSSNTDKVEDLVAKLADKVGITANDESGGNPDRETLIDEVVANSELESDDVDGIDDDCLTRLHDSVVGNSAEATESGGGETRTEGVEEPEAPEGTDEETEENEEETNDMEDEDIDKIVEAIDSRIDEKIDEKISANREQREKEDKVDSIVANSAEYTEDDRDTLMDTPDSVLDDIEQSVTGGGFNMPSANTGERSVSDDEEWEVSSGVAE